MFGLTKREQRWKAEQKAAETLIPMITAIAVEAMKQDDKDAEMARLTAELASTNERWEKSHQTALAIQDERDALRAQVAALTENGPPMQRGTTIEGTPWMGTMREVLEDYKSAADTEARWGDEARAEVAGLRKALAAAIRQNEHDMLMTGEELRAARAALGDKTPNVRANRANDGATGV